MTADTSHRAPGLPRRTSAAPSSTVTCDINTTPLIDIMLVLLVTLIVSLPLMTHSVKMDLPQASLAPDTAETITLDIEFDGTVLWNGTAIASARQLESYLRAEAQKSPQPEIHLRADRRAKYDFVAKVLASVQRSQIERMGFVDTAEFKD